MSPLYAVPATGTTVEPAFARRPKSLDNHTDKAQRDGIIGHNIQQYRRRWQRDRLRSRLQFEERDMWTTLFSLTLTAAICFGVAAIVLPHVRYLARFSG
jgi:hypothetical protein